MNFQFDVSYCKEDMEVFNRVMAKQFFPVRVLLIRVILLVTGIFLVFSGALFMVHSFGNLIINLSILLYGLFCIVRCIFHFKFSARASCRMLIKNSAQSVVTFDDEGFLVKSSEMESYYRYSGLAACCYCEGRYLLFQDKKHASVLPESAMTAGTPEQFRDFIAQKTGRPVKYVK